MLLKQILPLKWIVEIPILRLLPCKMLKQKNIFFGNNNNFIDEIENNKIRKMWVCANIF